jgi:hypothetical protein
MALMTYLSRDKNGTYYFRRGIPVSLRLHMPAPWTGKAEWKKSLGTKNPARAKALSVTKQFECNRDFEAAIRVSKGLPLQNRPASVAHSISLADIEIDVLSGLLAEDEFNRKHGDARRQLQTAKDRAQWPDLAPVRFEGRGMPVEARALLSQSTDENPLLAAQVGFDGEISDIEYVPLAQELLAEYREALAASDPQIVKPELRTQLRKHGIAVDPTSEFYYEAGLAVLRGHVRAYEQIVQRDQGAIVETPKPPKPKAHLAWKTGSKAVDFHPEVSRVGA